MENNDIHDATDDSVAAAVVDDRLNSGWIVGNSEGTRWRSWEFGNPVWVNDREKATRYYSRGDAEQVHAEDEDAWRVELFTPPDTHPHDPEVPEVERLRTENSELTAGCEVLTDQVLEQHNELVTLRDQLVAHVGLIEELREALEPFAKEAETWWDKIADDARPWIAEPGNHGGADAEFTIGDLRRARTALAKARGV